MNIITDIQTKLKAHKGQTNKFGGYQYRSCEDILTAAKPLLAEHDVFINLSDEMIMLGDRFYIKATAKIHSPEKGTLAESTGWARESFQRKGMDDSQITGTASSYARKYALNGLLAIDDTKDADAQDNRGYEPISPDPINQQRVQGAYEAYKEVMDADVDVMDYKRVQDGNERLTNDERMAVQKLFGKDKPEGSTRQYSTILKELIKMTEADLVNPEDFNNTLELEEK